MLELLKKEVCEANLDLVKNNLVVLTWGNVSAIDRENNLVVIKPSGVAYDKMSADDMVVVDMEGNVVDGKYRPSSDTKTHLELYKKYPMLGGITHTHSTFATSYAQSGRDIPVYGTTHADDFYGDIKCTRDLTTEEINGDYEKNTGLLIIDTIKDNNPLDNPAILCKGHGVFTFGESAKGSVKEAITLEQVAKMAYLTENLNPKCERISQELLDKHYYRKHGNNAYYGQK